MLAPLRAALRRAVYFNVKGAKEERERRALPAGHANADEHVGGAGAEDVEAYAARLRALDEGVCAAGDTRAVPGARAC